MLAAANGDERGGSACGDRQCAMFAVVFRVEYFVFYWNFSLVNDCMIRKGYSSTVRFLF